MTDRASSGARLQATFSTQARALFSKNAAQQKRNWKQNLFLISTPFVFCILLFVLQKLIDRAFDTTDNNCGCYCQTCCSNNVCRTNSRENPCQVWEKCTSYDESRCGFQYSSSRQAAFCSIPKPSSWPPVMQVASEGFRAHPWSPNAALLYTGADPGVADSMARSMFPVLNVTPEQQAAAAAWASQSDPSQGAIYASSISFLGATLGTWQTFPFRTYLVEPAFLWANNNDVIYNATLFNMLAYNYTGSPTFNPDPLGLTTLLNNTFQGTLGDLGGAQGTATVWPVIAQLAREADAAAINRLLYCGYRQSRCDGVTEISEYTQAWDFQDTNPAQAKYNVMMWYNASERFGDQGGAPPNIVRVNQGLNKAVNAFLNVALNKAATLIGMMDYPRVARKLSIDFNSLLGPLFFTWLCQMLLPPMLVNLVYEKEKRLRTMMKMHGLGDAAYWLIMYVWFLALNFVFTWVLIGFGSAIDLGFFRLTSYSLQFVFYFTWNNCLVAFAFLLSTVFRSSKTAVVVAFLYVFATGLVGALLLEQFVSQGHWWVIFLQLVPGFGLYRGLYEIAQYSFRASYQPGSMGLTWSSLTDDNNGAAAVMIIFAVEWAVFMLMAWYLEQVTNTGIGVPRHPLFFLGKRFGNTGGESLQISQRRKSAEGVVAVQVEAEDVRAEREFVDKILQEGTPTPTTAREPSRPDAASSTNLTARHSDSCSIVVHDLWKVFPPMGGKSDKVAVRGLSLAIERGECFGLLGPNGAGKSTSINILTGFLEPSAGTAWIEGHDIRNEMGAIYSIMGVCPQDNLLWETLTAREHLNFYGRLKNLKGQELGAAIEAALKSVNLWHGGVGDKQVRTYSGGMKRRLSVAISFIGNPLVVYLDEPSTGLDPASRHNLWDVVKHAKQDKGIILTTHSMEEAAVLCDRLGIFVGGQLVCIGNPRQLTARYGGYYVFTITTPPDQEGAADELVRGLAPGARLTYCLAGTRKYELPVGQVSLAGVFAAMEAAKARGLAVLDWGVANATLEEVFIKFAKSIGAEGGG